MLGDRAVYVRNLVANMAGEMFVEARFFNNVRYMEKTGLRVGVVEFFKIVAEMQLHGAKIFKDIPYENVVRGVESFMVAARVEGVE